MSLHAPGMRDWDKRAASACDSAVKSVTPYTATARRHLAIELVALKGSTAIVLRWDGATFYDLLAGSGTIANAMRQGFPVVALTFAMMGHRLPRALTSLGGTVGPVVSGAGGPLLAGCSPLTPLAQRRMCTTKILAQVAPAATSMSMTLASSPFLTTPMPPSPSPSELVVA